MDAPCCQSAMTGTTRLRCALGQRSPRRSHDRTNPVNIVRAADLYTGYWSLEFWDMVYGFYLRRVYHLSDET